MKGDHAPELWRPPWWLGFLWGFAFLPSAISIYGTIWALLIAYVALGTPIAQRMMLT